VRSGAKLTWIPAFDRVLDSWAGANAEKTLTVTVAPRNMDFVARKSRHRGAGTNRGRRDTSAQWREAHLDSCL